MQHRHTDIERTAYYRQEASACATAALTTAISEIKQAYLDLEQGWLCLAPKVEESSVASAPPISECVPAEPQPLDIERAIARLKSFQDDDLSILSVSPAANRLYLPCARCCLNASPADFISHVAGRWKHWLGWVHMKS